MDEGLPACIRDSRWFMYPFFRYWFKNKNLALYMDFKKRSPVMSDEEFARCYVELDCRATDRPTDLNEKSIAFMLEKLQLGATSLLDVGCGRGHWLERVRAAVPGIRVAGCDFFDESPCTGINYRRGQAEEIPFPDRSFDIVTCTHTLEHVRNLRRAVSELKRVSRSQIIVATPKQRYFYYSLDLHLHFFERAEDLTTILGLASVECRLCDGDWVCVGDVSEGKAE